MKQNPRTPEVSTILPTYNERSNLGPLIKEVHNALKKWSHEIIIVDDDSPDGTWKVAEKMRETYPVRVVRRKKEKGLSSAVLEGFKKAGSKKFVVLDADLQHPPQKIQEIVEELSHTDLVIASRKVENGGETGLNIGRSILSEGARFLAYLFLPEVRTVKDPLSGFFGVRKKVVEGVDFPGIEFKVLLEVLTLGNFSSYVEIPYVFQSRRKGKSKMDAQTIMKYLRHLIKLTRKY